MKIIPTAEIYFGIAIIFTIREDSRYAIFVAIIFIIPKQVAITEYLLVLETFRTGPILPANTVGPFWPFDTRVTSHSLSAPLPVNVRVAAVT